MMQQLTTTGNLAFLNGPTAGTSDGRHLHPWLNIALLNLLLNVAHRLLLALATQYSIAPSAV
jgi:hypothetical protein